MTVWALLFVGSRFQLCICSEPTLNHEIYCEILIEALRAFDFHRVVFIYVSEEKFKLSQRGNLFVDFSRKFLSIIRRIISQQQGKLLLVPSAERIFPKVIRNIWDNLKSAYLLGNNKEHADSTLMREFLVIDGITKHVAMMKVLKKQFLQAEFSLFP